MTPAYRNSLALLLVAALLVRLAAGWVWQSRLDGRFGMGDSESYWSLAQTIAEGKPYEYGADHARVFRTPGYPMLLAPIIRLAGDGRSGVLLARAEAALLGVLAVLAVWWLTRLLFDDRAALLAAAMATFYPGAIAGQHAPLERGPVLPADVAATGVLDHGLACGRADGKRRSMDFAAGWRPGRPRLMRPSWLLFTPLAAGVGILAGLVSLTRDSLTVKRPSRHFEIAGWMILGLVVAMLPWWVRNARRHRPLRAHHASGRRQPVRRPESRRHRGQQHGLRAAVRGPAAASIRR